MVRHALVAIFALAFVAAACGGPAPSSPPSGSPAPEPTPDGSGAPSGPATWWVDPAELPLTPETDVIKGFIVEAACASGQSPEGRVLEPKVEYRADAVVVTYSVTQRPGGQDCQSNPEFRVELRLTEPLGTRAILDGSASPPRDATTTP